MSENYKNSYKATDKELVSLSVYNVGCQRCDPGYQWGPGIRDHYLIHYIISGKGSYRVKGSTHHLEAGDVFLIYPNTEVVYQADESDPWEYAWVGFNGSDAATILTATDFSATHPYIHHVPHKDLLIKNLLRIYEIRGNEFEHLVEMSGQLYLTLSLLVRDAKKKETSNTAQTYVQKSIEYISANYSYPITIEDIASYVGLSRSHLFRSFELVMHQSPKEYLTDFRMKQACYLLQHSSLSITAIANSVGFDNGFYFSRSFHKKKNMSPKEYRQNIKKTPE